MRPALAGAGTLALVSAGPAWAWAVAALLVITFAGVVLPAVWSRDPQRRTDARAVLTILLKPDRRLPSRRRPSGRGRR